MASTYGAHTITDTLQTLQDKVRERQASWIQVQQTFTKVENIIRSVEASANARRQRGHVDARTVIFEERIKFTDMYATCMNLRGVKRKFQDSFMSLKTLMEFEEQTMDDLVQELKLSDYTHLFGDHGIQYARQLLDLDQKALFEPNMKVAPYKRLQRKIERIKGIKDYVEYRLDGDISSAAKDTQRELRGMGEALAVSFTTIDGLQRQLQYGEVMNPYVLQPGDVLGLALIGFSALLALYVYRPILSPMIVVMTGFVFGKNVWNAVRWYRQADADSQNTQTPVAVRAEVAGVQWSVSMRRWVVAMTAELNLWVQLMTSFKGQLQSTGGGIEPNISGNMRRTESQLERFLEDVDALEAELKRICSGT